jgi:hypothetical protein
MSVRFATDAPDLTSAVKDIGIDLGGIEELGDDMGINLISRPTAGSPKPASSQPSQPRTVNFGSNTDIPSIKIAPVMDDLEVVNLDFAPSASDVKITRSEEPAPFVIQTAKIEQPPVVVAPVQSTLEIKEELISKLERLDAKGITGKHLTRENTVEELRAEVHKRTDSKNLEASMRFQRNALVTFVTGVEMLNDKAGHRLPIKPRLKGFSESVQTNIEDYDDIFEELYDLYKDGSNLHPLVRLVGTLGVSAAMFHLTNTMAENSGIPHMKDVLNENPELRKQMARAMVEQMGGMGAFMDAASGGGDRIRQEAPAAPAAAAPTRGPMFNGSSAAPRREMRPPENVDDILSAMEEERKITPAQHRHPIFAGDDQNSTGSTTSRRGRPRKPQTAPVGSTLDLS